MTKARSVEPASSMLEILSNHLVQPHEEHDRVHLDVDKVANEIFAQPGKKFSFVFKQNLRRTNMQIAELVALARFYVTDVEGKPIGARLDFMNFEEIKATIQEVSEHTNLSNPADLERLAEKVIQICADTALLEIYYGTAAIFLPQNMKIDLMRICGESGYIHSCGELLLLRNAEKTSSREFHRGIQEAIDLPKRDDDRFMLIPFCHEDFSKEGRKTSFAQHGLDDVKLHISKGYIEGKHLYEVMDDVRDKYKKSVIVAPTDFSTSAAHFQQRFPGKRLNSIWLIGDSDARLGSRFPGNKKFYIMYIQRFKNSNLYHIYDENKPGWASHTTLPHSLAGAMLSLSRPWMGRSEATIIDPFGGSGTTILESHKLGYVTCQSRDLAAITAYTVKDNFDFFRLERGQLDALHRGLTDFKGLKLEPEMVRISRPSDGTPQEVFERIFQVVRGWYRQCGGDFLRLPADQLTKGFRKVIGAGDTTDERHLLKRLVVYVALRASVRGAPYFHRKKEASWLSFFERELTNLLDQIECHLKWLPSEAPDGGGRLRMGRSMYSDTTVPPRPEFSKVDLFKRTDYEVRDVKKLEADTYDAIITDPPYGFNTDEGSWDAAEFVEVLVPSLVRALKLTGGQLILAAPDISYSGRRIIPFVRASYLIRSIIRYCASNGRECYVPAVALPGTLRLLRPPYYWVAEKTLQRKILHFWIRAAPATSSVYLLPTEAADTLEDAKISRTESEFDPTRPLSRILPALG